MDYKDKRIKVYNRIFMEAEYSFSDLKIYYNHIVALLNRESRDNQEFINELKEANQQKNQPFDEIHWQKYHKIFSERYPGYFHNSFLISVCSLFEYQVTRLCAYIQEEHKVPKSWDDIEKGSVSTKTKRFLNLAGIELKDDPPGTVQYLLAATLEGKGPVTVKDVWLEIENYFKVRNCLAHQNGFVQKLRYPDKVMKYATDKKILTDKSGQPQILLNQSFNIEICETMMKFFEKLTSAYYGTPLPE